MPIRADQLKEKEDYQKLILERLEQDNGYIVRDAKTDYNAAYAMDTTLLFEFLGETQPKAMERLRKNYKEKTEQTILAHITKEIAKRGSSLIHVLKNGVEFDNNVTLKLMFRKPATSFNPELSSLYDANRLSVMEEVYHKDDERIDLVIFLNGFAIFAVELKCNTSGQTYEDAIRQYKNTRDSDTRLFKFKIGVFAAFAMDLNEVHFCTQLKRQSSFFMPFNKGANNGRGNPHNESGINVSYMWEDIWTKDKVIWLIERFIFVETKRKTNPDTKKTTSSETLIFPRFHQLRAVERLIADMKVSHTDCNYLIEHSAGSGKTNTIAWLSHTLASLHDDADNVIFSNIIIITDRIIVDRQLQDAISQIEHKTGLLAVMDDDKSSSDLAEALAGNTRIIVTTVHKFFYILKNNLLGSMKDKTFAVLIDEAHSSTEGTLMQAVTEVLSGGVADGAIAGDNNVEGNNGAAPSSEDDGDDDKTVEDYIDEEIQRSGKQPNVSMIAFTATPKPTTIQLFGILKENGNKGSFDVYSMKQAIEEGYILNVLDNYMTYQTFFEVNKAVDEDPELQSIAAKRKIARFVDLHPTNIFQKVEIIIEHFRRNIAPMLDGKAKAMVVTSSRPAAVKYRNEFDRYIKAHGYTNIHALVAFSGKVTVDGISYTEDSMNNIEGELRDEFDRSFYQVLLVANKYQTGFDQPKLVAMYVDKKLKGVSAVQTLSRLNRIFPPYDKRTFILDFKNEYADIKNAFAPYYEETELFETASPHDIRELADVIESYGILSESDVNRFNEYLYKAKRNSRDKEKMWSLLDGALKKVQAKPLNERIAIRTTIRRFLRQYRFIIQATSYENVELHKRYNFLAYLINEIDVSGGGNDFEIADKVTVSDFEQRETGSFTGEGEVEARYEVKLRKQKPAEPEIEQLKMLSLIIEEINAIYGTHHSVDVAKTAAMQIRDLLLADERLRASAKSNSLADFSFTYGDSVSDALVDSYDQNVDFYTLLLGDPELRDKITRIFMDDVYKKLRGE
jgi:type I restriction enzyme R subunit